MKSQIVITGAGVAGSSLAIHLANNGFSVLLIEREKFPRQKLCGEFISPECFSHLRQLGVLETMQAAGGNTIVETVFFAPNGARLSIPSTWFRGDSAGALCLSRAEMDFRLLQRARNQGVEVLEETQITGLLWENEEIQGVRARTKSGKQLELAADLTVDASGRAAVLSKFAVRDKQKKRGNKLALNVTQNPKPEFIGFKAHLKNAEIEQGVCEIYFFRDGYAGLCQVENGVGNLCFLIKASVVRKLANNAERVLREIVFQNERAAETLKQIETVHGWLAVSIDGFGKKNLAPAPKLLTVGDAAAFIDPFTGSGMLMAFESSEIAAQAISANYGNANEIAAAYQKLHEQKFKARLQFCSLFRRAAFAPRLAAIGIRALNLSRSASQMLVKATRR